ncbi:MAG: hypothetical protein PVH38_06770 [Gammaproteobacteria bacterium]|jgi:hypothetical protein
MFGLTGGLLTAAFATGSLLLGNAYPRHKTGNDNPPAGRHVTVAIASL